MKNKSPWATKLKKSRTGQALSKASSLNENIDILFERTKLYYSVVNLLNRDIIPIGSSYINYNEKLIINNFSTKPINNIIIDDFIDNKTTKPLQHLELIMINQALEKNTQEQAELLTTNINSIEKQLEKLNKLQTEFETLTAENLQLHEKIVELSDDNAHYESLLEALLVSLQMANDKIVTLQTSFKNAAL